MYEDIIKIISRAVADAGYARGQGSHRDGVTIELTIEQCDGIAMALDDAYTAVACARQDTDVMDVLTALGEAFRGRD